MQKPSVVYEDNQGAIFVANNRQVGMRTKNIDIRHHFLRDVLEDKDMDINYIMREAKPADIIMKIFLKPIALNTRKTSQRENSGRSWKLKGRMSRITELWMESWIVTQMNIPVKHLLKLRMGKTGISVSWSKYTGLVSKKMNKIIM